MSATISFQGPTAIISSYLPPTDRIGQGSLQVGDIWLEAKRAGFRRWSGFAWSPLLSHGDSEVVGSVGAEFRIQDSNTRSANAIPNLTFYDRNSVLYSLNLAAGDLIIKNSLNQNVQTLKANGDVIFGFNVQIVGDLIIDDLSADVITLKDRIQHDGNISNNIRFDVDKLTLDASGTSIILDDTAMTNNVQITGSTQFVNNIDDVPDIYLRNHVHHYADTNTRIGFPANDQIALRTGGTDRVLVTDSRTTIGPELQIADGAPKLLANTAGTITSRFAIQASNANGNTRYYVIPSGTGVVAATYYNNKSDLSNPSANGLDVGIISDIRAQVAIANGGTAPIIPIELRHSGYNISTASASVVSGRTYAVISLGTTTLPQWNSYFSLAAIPSLYDQIVANNTGTVSGAPGLAEVFNGPMLTTNYNAAGFYQGDNVVVVGYDTPKLGGAPAGTSQWGIMMPKRSNIQWDGSGDGGPYVSVFRSASSGSLVAAYGYRADSSSATNWQSSASATLARSAVEIGSGIVKIFANDAVAGTAGSNAGMTPIPQMYIGNGYAEAKSMRGWNYPATGSVSPGVGVHLTDITCQGQMLYELVFFANPNLGGSSMYKAVYEGRVVVSTGWNGSTPTCYITYIQLVDGSPSGVGGLTIVARFYNVSTGYTTNVPQTSINSQVIAIQVSGYNSSYVNADATLYLCKKI